MPKKKTAGPTTDTLLVELLTEELPPKALQTLAIRFRDALAAHLDGASLLPRPRVVDPRCLGTPRRIAVLIQGVLEKATDLSEKTAGPLVSAGVEAAKGFAKKWGVAVESLEKIQTSDGEKWLARYTTAGAVLDDILAQKVEEALKVLPIPKLMRWGNGEAQFARPVHGLVMMHGKRVITGSVLGVSAGNATSGHRFMGTASIRLANANDYEAKLRKDGHVIADFAARKSEIDKQLRVEAKRQKATLGAYQDVLDEVTALVEFPAVYAGEFDALFLDVPQECLILSMQQHQRYFPLVDSGGKLMPRFLIVSNMRTGSPANIIRGNERVLRARLSDAKFFYEQDCKERLERRVPRLAQVIYHNKLGSQLERVERIQLLAGKIAREIGADPLLTERAAWLSKADLLTEMVGEFPELQGIMGRYYALHDGEPKEVADAIKSHYRPRFAGDVLPDGPIASAVALADKLDTLAGLFGIGQVPTGDKDPFALRRAALGVIRILLETPLELDLFSLLRAAEETFPSGLIGSNPNMLREFVQERLRNYLRDRGENSLYVEAVIGQLGGLIYQAPARLNAVKQFAKLPEAKDLAAANKRVLNIIRKNEEIGYAFKAPDRSLMKEPAEIALMDAVDRLTPLADRHFETGDYESSLRLLAGIKPDVDCFFDKVMVMVDDQVVRNNRAALLQQLGRLMNRVADISKLAV